MMTSSKEKAVLALLEFAGEEIDGMTIRKICRLGDASAYVMLSRMEEKGLIVSRRQTRADTGGVVPRGGLFRRVYKHA